MNGITRTVLFGAPNIFAGWQSAQSVLLLLSASAQNRDKRIGHHVRPAKQSEKHSSHRRKKLHSHIQRHLDARSHTLNQKNKPALSYARSAFCSRIGDADCQQSRAHDRCSAQERVPLSHTDTVIHALAPMAIEHLISKQVENVLSEARLK